MHNSFGLDDELIQNINNLFSKYSDIEQAGFFGSRAKGNYKKYSDIDIILFGNIEGTLLAKILFELDELNTAHTFDVVMYSEITNCHLKQHIDQNVKIFFRRPKCF